MSSVSGTIVSRDRYCTHACIGAMLSASYNSLLERHALMHLSIKPEFLELAFDIRQLLT